MSVAGYGAVVREGMLGRGGVGDCGKGHGRRQWVRVERIGEVRGQIWNILRCS